LAGKLKAPTYDRMCSALAKGITQKC
jgi:hypothetical protein